MKNIAFEAMVFARLVHKQQVRKYTGNPYSDHLAEVSGIVSTVDASPESIASAWLHDCREDQGITALRNNVLKPPCGSKSQKRKNM